MLRPHSLEMFIFGQFSSNNLWGEKKHKQQGLAPLLRAAASLFEFSFLVNNSHFHVWLLCKKNAHRHRAAGFIAALSCFWAAFSGTCHFLHTVLLIGPLCISNEANVAAGAELWGKASVHQLCSLKAPSSFPQTLSPSSLATLLIHHVDSLLSAFTSPPFPPLP